MRILVRARPDRWLVVVPQNEAWEELIENNFPAFKRIRYATRKDTKFDRKKLEAMANALPQGYAFRRIDTVRQERHKGLGSAAAAKLILECLDEGLYAAWDAANRMSILLAEKLGYEFSREYVVYGFE